MIYMTMTITLNPSTDNYEYEIKNIQKVNHKQEKPAMNISLPGQGYRDAILMGIEGQTADISIEFMIKNDGTDKANGTYSSTVTTIDEQMDYIEDVIHDSDFTSTWQLNDNTNNRYDNEEVFIENIDIEKYKNHPSKWYSCRIDLIIGKTI